MREARRERQDALRREGVTLVVRASRLHRARSGRFAGPANPGPAARRAAGTAAPQRRNAEPDVVRASRLHRARSGRFAGPANPGLRPGVQPGRPHHNDATPSPMWCGRLACTGRVAADSQGLPIRACGPACSRDGRTTTTQRRARCGAGVSPAPGAQRPIRRACQFRACGPVCSRDGRTTTTQRRARCGAGVSPAPGAQRPRWCWLGRGLY